MKRIILTLGTIVLAGISALAQNNQGATDDIGRIVISPMVASNTVIPTYAHDLLSNKLTQVVTTNGLGGNSYDRKFVITANFVETYKEVSTGVPAIYSVKLDATFYVGDISNGTLFASCNLGEIKGAGKSETKAYMAAVKNIRANDPRLLACLDQAKVKIIEYYNSQIDFLIQKANALADQEEYWAAIDVLMDVPEICKDAHARAMNAVQGIYQKKIDKESAEALATATAIWNANLSYYGAEQAAEWLSRVHPNSSSAKGAAALNQQIAKRLKEIDKREWEYKVQEQKNDYNLAKAGIEAAKAVGVAQAKRPIYNTVVYWW